MSDTKQLLTDLSSLLDQALDLAPDARAVWAAQLRLDQPALARELEALLAAEVGLDACGFLERDRWADLAEPMPSLAGRRLAAYTLDGPLGKGGMGTVWLAHRSDGRFEGRAAVKLLNLALLDSAGSERFHREGTTLARLGHPNIARLIDAGVTDTGEPFLILEYVEGRRLDVYCDEERLSPDQRLRLLLQVLDAVGHAHANLVVHRDIKPSNILVAADGTVKLLDFGIAKLLEPDGSAERSALTNLGGLALTPEYAAPEQATGGPITTATDVYSLGVLLYLLVAGRHPTGEGCRSPAEYLRAISDTEPLRLSVAVTAAGARSVTDLARVAAARGVTEERLHRHCRGDLENIVAKALKKRPEERYGTVAAFADDLRRYLGHDPVSARRDSLSYRAGKFIRRNRTAVTLASLGLLALVAGLVGTVTQSQRASRQASLAAVQRDRADREAHTAEAERDFALRQVSHAEAVNDLNTFLLSDAAPSGRPISVGALLAQAEDVVQREYGESDVNRVEMLAAIGEDYLTLDEDSNGYRVLSRTYELSRTLTDRSTRARAGCALARVVASSGDSRRAETLIAEGFAELPAAPQFALDRVTCFLSGSYVARESGDSKGGVARAEAARRALGEVRFPTGVLETRVLMDLAESYRMADRLVDADSVFQETFARLKSLGREKTETAGTLLNNWALTLDQMGQALRAEPLYRQAIRISSDAGGTSNISPVLLRNLASNLCVLGRLREAAQYADLAYAQAQRQGDQIAINQALITLAQVYRDRGELSKAAAALSEVEPRLQRALPPGHYAFAAIRFERGLLAEARGDELAALVAFDSAIAVAERATQGSFVIPLMLGRRAKLELDLHRLDDAERDATRALELQQHLAQPGVASQKVGLAYLTLGNVMVARGKADSAHSLFTMALEQLRPTLGPDHPKTRMVAELVRGPRH